MLDNLQSYLKFGSTYCGIEQTDDNIYSIVIKRTKTELNIDKKFECSTVDDLTENLPKNQHSVLCVNTSQVLTKEITTNATNHKEVLNAAFPNLKTDEFYFNFIKTKEKTFVSICRKEIIRDLLNSFSKAGIFIIDFIIGPAAVNHLSSFISGTILLNNYETAISNKEITSIQKSNQTANILNDVNGLEVSQKHMLSLACALQNVLNLEAIEGNQIGTSADLLKDFSHKRFFKLFLQFGIVALLAILLINFLFFSYYFDGVNELQQQAQTNTANKTKLVQLNEVVERKKQLTDNLLTAASSNSSQRIDAIIKVLPSSVILSEINYHPLQRSIKDDKEIEVLKNQIVLSGRSNNKVAFTKWVEDMEDLVWISSIVTVNYKEEGANAQFTITINESQ